MDILSNRSWFKYWPEGVPQHIDYPNIPLYELLTLATNKYPEAIAFSYDNEHITYSALDKASSKLASFLQSASFTTKDTVLLLLPNCIEFVIAYYGILKSGATVCPSNPSYSIDELVYQINDSGATGIITKSTHCDLIHQIKQKTKLKTIVFTDSLENSDDIMSLSSILRSYSVEIQKQCIDPQKNIAAIQYTGGTTGFPKGAMLTHSNLVANAIQNAVWFKWNNKDIIAGVIPFYHSWGVCTCVISPVYAGVRVIIFQRFDIECLLEAIEKERITVLYGATSMFITLANSEVINKYDLSSLRYVKAGAMPIPPEIKEKWEKTTGVKMILGYGLSEASPEVTNSPPQRVKIGTIGIPIMDTDAKILDEATGTIELAPGQIGELVIKGPQVMSGYRNRPDDNKEVMRGGWLYTGDLAFMDDDGYLHITDRKKETIKYKGYTIAPAEVEATLYQHPAVKECAVVGKQDAPVGEIPKAYIVLKDGYKVSEEEMIQFCKQRISAYKRIREVEFIAEIPKSQIGKILRRILKNRA